MSNVLRYKGYWATVEYDAEDEVLHGKIEGISDLVTFECEEAKDALQEFKAAVDDYEAFCRDLGKAPEKPYSGSFNVRVSPAMHRQICMEAAKRGVTLNKYVSDALAQSCAASADNRQTTVL